MIWKNGLTWQEKRERKVKYWSEWRSWLAWYPVVVAVTKDKHEIKAWFSMVQRRRNYAWHRLYYEWEYKPLDSWKGLNDEQ